ncbi:MAG: hypothetical protein H6983_17770 [Ectothiorhodospiraceae bacterium]|nr:hypothetical protein [Chromatiales bacterium]MCP5156025.1 hypothetical protein [Ectothiorhodospiraceae bacterium]
MVEPGTPRVVPHSSLRQYFQHAVSAAIEHQRIGAEEGTVCYLVNLLTDFTRTDRLYDRTPDGMMLRPLAALYAEAIEGPTTEQRLGALRRLGDVALFISGVFSQSLANKVVDVDYYISMGGSAYGSLSQTLRGGWRDRALGDVFGELSDKFTDFVDVLGEASERNEGSDADILRLYEVWLRTGSRRAAEQLRHLGFEPSACPTGQVRH